MEENDIVAVFLVQDDIDLMIHYPDSDAHLAMDMDRSRAMQLPLWSDVGGAGGGGLDGGHGATGGHVAPTHPLLSRQTGAETGTFFICKIYKINESNH